MDALLGLLIVLVAVVGAPSFAVYMAGGCTCRRTRRGSRIRNAACCIHGGVR